MGLDVTFWKDIVFVREDDPDDLLIEEEGTLHVFAYDEFKDHYMPLPDGYYKGKEVTSFRAGSYGGYDEWRDSLCKIVTGMTYEEFWIFSTENEEKAKEMPFYYLIHFADNEGVIASYAFKKLASDFESFTGKFDNEWDQELFEQWKDAVARSDCVEFH